MDIQKLVKEYVYWPELQNHYQKNIDFSNTTLNEIHPLIESILNEPMIPVNDSIIKFYTLNEALGLIRQREEDILNPSSLELYNEYQKQLSNISQKIFVYILLISTMEARHCRDKMDEHTINRYFDDFKHEYLRDNLYNTDAYEKANYDDLIKLKEKLEDSATEYADARVAEIKNKKMSHFSDNIVNPRKFQNFSKTFSLIEEIGNLSNYSRHHVSTQAVPLFTNVEYCDLSISDYLESLETLFNIGSFETGYGGKSWADIAKHALRFATGEINAEVFIDQAFSLEHNSGQIFNKDIIFDSPSPISLYSYEGEYSYSDEDNFYTSQILLNLQHQGQLLSFLNSDFSSVNDILLSFTKRKDDISEYSAFQKQIIDNIKSKNIAFTQKYSDKLYNAISYVYYNSKNLYESFHKDIQNSAEDVKNTLNNIKQYNLKTPILDFSAMLLPLFQKKSPKYKERPEPHDEFFNLCSVVINNSLTISAPPIKNTHFNFEYFPIKDISETNLNRNLLGNKAFGLAQMEQAGLPVPKAIVLPTTNAQSFFSHNEKWNQKLEESLDDMVNQFNDEQGNPLLFSVRSGAAVSMPGMMDTILNVGIDDTNYEYFCAKMGKSVTDECVNKFTQLFMKSFFNSSNISNLFNSSINNSLAMFKHYLDSNNIQYNKNTRFPFSRKEQLKHCLAIVFKSWNSERATAYRNHHNLSHDMGTAAIVQQMVFGNLNYYSGTGVVFSRDCITGKKGIIGEYLQKAQGEDVVSGSVTPLNISELEVLQPQAYQQLVQICEKLEQEKNEIQDIEFTIEDEKLYILQKRKAVSSNVAQTTLNMELYSLGKITQEELVSRINISHLIPTTDVIHENQTPINKGLIGNPGIMRGIVVHCEQDMLDFAGLYAQHQHEPNFGWIFYSQETSPDNASIMLKTDAYITSNGGFTSHAAILARSWNKPCVVGVGHIIGSEYMAGTLLTVDANNGHIYSGTLPVIENKDTIKAVADLVLEHYKINSLTLEKNIEEQNTDALTWMEKYPNTLVKPKSSPNIDKFLDIGHKAALFLVKDNKKKICP